jgi:3-polyprenyl-4-hydroxybenzoate decarboxylase
MDFADYSDVTYDLYRKGQVDEDGLMVDNTPLATIDHAAFEALGLRNRVNWGDVSPSYDETLHGSADACEISQGGEVR